MADAVFYSGNPHYVDYTPSTDITAGTVVVIGDVTYIAHVDLEANRVGAVAESRGSYKVVADAAINGGAAVYWDDTAKKVTATSLGNKRFGFLHPTDGSAADGDIVQATHHPGLGT